MIPFRQYHLLQLLSEFEGTERPLDLFLHSYFRNNKALGSKDRAYIAENVYGMVRWQGLLDHLTKKPLTWENRWETYTSFDPKQYIHNTTLPKHLRCSFPKPLFDRIVHSLGEEKGFEVCIESNAPAPLFIRTNTLKITREKLLNLWKGDGAFPCEKSPLGICFESRKQLFSTQEFKDGFFEVQDEGSQLLAGMVETKPGELVLDYCCGSGGKALAIACLMDNKGQIYLHDVRPHILQEAKKRLKRAGIQNGQIHLNTSLPLQKLKKKMDWVLVDAPCSGTGTMRRNPDMKWKYTNEMLWRLVGEQRNIFEKALSFVKPGGHIVYGTCSLLQEENQQQVEHFLNTYPIKQVGPSFQSLPATGKMDGFFGAKFVVN